MKIGTEASLSQQRQQCVEIIRADWILSVILMKGRGSSEDFFGSHKSFRPPEAISIYFVAIQMTVEYNDIFIKQYVLHLNKLEQILCCF